LSREAGSGSARQTDALLLGYQATEFLTIYISVLSREAGSGSARQTDALLLGYYAIWSLVGHIVA